MEYVSQHGTETKLVRRDLAGQRHPHERAAMEASGKGDERVAAGGGTGDLDSILDGFCARCHKYRLFFEITRNDGIQPLGKTDIVLVGNNLMAGMGKPIELVFDRFNDLGMAVTSIDHGNTGGEIDKSASLDVPYLGIFRPVHIDLRHHSYTACNRLIFPG